MDRPNSSEKGVAQITLHTDAAPLNNEEMAGAIKNQVTTYRQVVRSLTDSPLLGQSSGLLSFLLFDEPKKTKRGKYVYGFVKLRGNYPDEIAARRAATSIVKDQDSKYRIHIGPTGTWLPITDDDDFISNQYDVKMEEEEMHFRDEAAHEAEATRQRRVREIREREEELRNDKNDPYSDKESLKYYTMKRVTEKELRNNVDIIKNRLDDIVEKLEMTRKELYDLDLKHEEYATKWLDLYNSERRKSGITDYIPNETMLKEFEDWKQCYAATRSAANTHP